MNISHQLQEIGVFLAENRFVTILEYMAVPLVAMIERDGIARQ
jgi:uncharacterized membrane protein